MVFLTNVGLAGTICSLYHDLDGDLYCCYGNLKPANILFFEEDRDSLLVIADIGESKIYE